MKTSSIETILIKYSQEDITVIPLIYTWPLESSRGLKAIQAHLVFPGERMEYYFVSLSPTHSENDLIHQLAF